MPIPAGRSAFERLSEMPVARVVAYYVLLIAGTILLVRLFPDQLSHLFTAERMEELARVPRHGDLSALAGQPPADDDHGDKHDERDSAGDQGDPHRPRHY